MDKSDTTRIVVHSHTQGAITTEHQNYNRLVFNTASILHNRYTRGRATFANSMTSADELSWGEKIAALRRVAAYRPTFTLGLVLFGGLAAVLEGVGLGFIYPILEVAQTEGPVEGGGPYSIPS